MIRKTTLVPLLLTAAALACSTLAGSTDLTATETAVAAKVMTQLAVQTPNSQVQTPNPPPTSNVQPPTSNAPGGAPQFNPFQNLTADQEACLKQAWGDETFQAITSFQRPPSPEETKTMDECGLPKPTPGGGPGGAGQPGSPQAGGTGPAPGGQPAVLKDQTYFTTSSDGLTWVEGTLLAEKASVPEVIFTSQGVYWAYWVDFSQFTGPGSEKIGIARSTDGVAWEKLGMVQFSGMSSGMATADPDVMELADGRLRMYFYDIGGPQGQNTIYSAVSSDGVNFTLESGTRFTLANVYDPNVVVLPDGRYRMYLNMADIVSATSSDGLTFTKDDGVRVERGAVPGAIVLPDGSVRLYTCGEGISVYKSTDGLNFAVEKKGVIAMPSGGGLVCDPSVTATPNGFMMVYKYNPGK